MSISKKIEKKYKVMGGEFVFMCYPQNFHTKHEVETIFDKAYAEVKRIEDKFTDFRESEFNRINELAGVKPCPVDDEIFSLIEKAITCSKDSKGIFDITYASVGHAWREAKVAGKSLAPSDRNSLLKWINYKKIKLNKKKKTVFLPRKEMKIGLGGIGKGYAVDRAYKVLKESGLYNFYVNGSGDIRVHSHKSAPRKWKIGIRNPLSQDASKSVGVLQLANGAVATSGSYVHKIENCDETLDHHIVNPSSGRSVNEIISSTILCETCVESDTTATIVMNMSGLEARNYLNNNNIFGVVIDKSGKSFLSNKAMNSFGI